ncbi:MAG: hypothetical protein JSV84_17340 [Gemmatimonadota bacterium]|nr:MAG: hypothetical protein JSV84_17340 [Gemmatimonadota bacterium]
MNRNRLQRVSLSLLIGALVPAICIDLNSSYSASLGTRETKDADFVLRVKNWNDFERIKEVFAKHGFEKREHEVEQRLFFGNAVIDLLPYGAELLDGNCIEWPVSGKRIDVRGFDQVFLFAEKRELVPGFKIPTIPLWLSVVLKMGAYLDRGYRRDVIDILYILEHVEESGEQSRRFDVIADGITYETSGAFLIGRDIRQHGSERVIPLVKSFLSLIDDAYAKPIQEILREERRISSNERRQHLHNLFLFLKKGLEV